MIEMRLSIRMLEAAAPHLRRSRLHSIVHPDPAKRRPMRVDEANAICNALGISQWEAAFGSELLDGALTESSGEASNLAAFMATVFAGLAPRIANAVARLSGLDLSDVRPEHGAQIQISCSKALRKDISILRGEKGFGYSTKTHRSASYALDECASSADSF